MPKALKTHKLKMLQPLVKELAPSIKMLSGKTLKQRQAETGRTLALNGAAWRKLRALVLTQQPLCNECKAQGYIVPAVEVDHRDDNPANNLRDNLVGLCKMHHGQRTRGVSVKGCDEHGRPLDPRHPWNEKSPATDGMRTVRLPSRTPPQSST
ncbi:MAG: HNH endonuclease signature motif containing protein [Rubrivivax sp.]|nr:HNH endonuclease signature motif containing protein [Rubrivivax sp.]